MRELNIELLTAVREVQNAKKKADNAFADTMRRYKLTPEGAKAEKQKAADATRTVQSTAKQTGITAIHNKIAELDQRESEAAKVRALDDAYLQRLDMKIRLFNGMNADGRKNTAALKDFFSEFANDPVAIAAIAGAAGGTMGATGFIPEDNTGKRQKHLLEVVLPAFERAISAVVIDPGTGYQADFTRDSRIEGFCAYCMKQNADFSLDDATLGNNTPE